MPGGRRSKKHGSWHSKAKTPKPDPSKDKVYVVERIDGKRLMNGRIEVHTKWAGHPAEESTWEPLVNLNNCMPLLQDYEIKQFQQKGIHQEVLCDYMEHVELASPFSMSPLRVSPEPDERLEELLQSLTYTPLTIKPGPETEKPEPEMGVAAPRKVRRIKKKARKTRIEDDDDDDDDIPWDGNLKDLMTPYKGVFGYARGLELDKVVHYMRLEDNNFLFVKWKGHKGTDCVRFDEVREAHPEKLVEYFENLPHRYN